MKKKSYLLAILLSWFAFGIWEYLVQQWVLKQTSPVIRVDLVFMLPILALITIYSLSKMYTHIKCS